ncbi:MAG: PQQ-dependent dehydrogenase, methanol/ethanol family [Novosphingobium sp.]
MALALSLVLAGCHGANAPDAIEASASADVIARQNLRLVDKSDGKDWPAYGRTYGENHFSPLEDINIESVGRLGLIEWLDLPPQPVATQLIEVDGVIYMSSGLSIVRAIDAVTGKELWLFDPKVGEVAGRKMIPAWGNRGIAYWNGKVYTGTMDGRLIAVDARTGKQVWSAATGEADDDRFITGAPRVFNGRVIIGHGGADTSNVRGYVTTYDAETGKQLWRFYTVPGNPADGFENKAMEMAARTWSGQWWKYGGGANAWNAFAYDPETETIFVGTGNGAPWNHRIRSQGKGDNLFVCSILALDGKTGAYKWHYQVNPGETWDYNAAMDMHLADVTIDGNVHKALIQAPKNGFLYAIDRVTGKLLAANRIAKVTWASGIDLKTGRPIENPAARFPNGTSFEMWPSHTGAHSSATSAFDPRNGVAFIPLIEHGESYNDRGIDTTQGWQRTPGGVFDYGVNIDLSEKISDPLNNTSYLLAVDAATGKPLWKKRTPRNFNGGLMVTAGNLVFQGQNDGKFNAYDSRNGKRLWSFDAQAPVIAAPITYSVNGKQYVAVIAGMGTSASPVLSTNGFHDLPDYRVQQRRVLIFALNGSAKLPPKPVTPPAPVDADYKSNPALETKGSGLFNANCLACHGIGGISGGGAPDLTQSPVLLDADTFKAIVQGGALRDNGMPQFSKFSDADIEAMRQHLRASAKTRRSK